MFRMLNCVRKRDDITDEEFRYYWNCDQFDDLVSEACLLLGAREAQRNLMLHIELNDRIRQERGGMKPFDATIEYWWDNAAALPNKDMPEMQDWLHRMNEFQRKFIDFNQSSLFITDWKDGSS